jgi:hypothetical protein
MRSARQQSGGRSCGVRARHGNLAAASSARFSNFVAAFQLITPFQFNHLFE